MSERLSSPIEFNPKQVEDIRKIGQHALFLSEEAYCSGYPHFRGGKVFKMGYHNRRHNFMTARDTVRVGSEMGLDPSGLALADATGSTHDLVQRKGRGVDERKSAEWIERQLRDKGLPRAAAVLSTLAILGTEPIFQDGILVDQQANHLDYPSRYAEVFAKSLASGDLGELYTPTGPYLAHRLYAQIKGKEVGQEPPLDGLLDFQGKQLTLYDGYHYPLGDKAERILATHKPQVVSYSEYVYRQIQRGDIESLGQLLRQDEAFMHDPDMRLR